MPLPQLWAVCFFIMVILLGADTQVGNTAGFILNSLFFMSFKALFCAAVCHPGMPDDFGDRHVPHRVPKGISARAAASGPLLCVFFPRPSTSHGGQNSLRLLPPFF